MKEMPEERLGHFPGNSECGRGYKDLETSLVVFKLQNSACTLNSQVENKYERGISFFFFFNQGSYI